MMLLLALTVVGCGGGGGGSTGATNVVTGIVLDSRQQDTAVGGATVTIGGKTTTTVTVDQANANNPVGSFRLENVELGANTAVITAPGQQPQTIVFSPPVGPGTNPALELLINIGQITGRVLGPNGQPARDAFVSDEQTAQVVQTDAEGRFLIELVPLGPNRLTAVLGTASGTKEIEVGDGVTDAGDITLVDDPVTTPPGPPYTVGGKVTLADDPGNAAAARGTDVIVLRNNIQIEVTTVNNDQGTYFLYLPPNNYTLRFRRSSYVDLDVPVTVTNPNQPVTVDVTLQLR
jgi:hypothetical protein